jgi:hypothetical protein
MNSTDIASRDIVMLFDVWGCYVSEDDGCGLLGYDTIYIWSNILAVSMFLWNICNHTADRIVL